MAILIGSLLPGLLQRIKADAQVVERPGAEEREADDRRSDEDIVREDRPPACGNSVNRDRRDHAANPHV